MRYSVTPQKVSFEIDAVDAAWNTDTAYEDGNLCASRAHKGGYFPVNLTTPPGHPRRDAVTMKRNWHQGRQAPPRGRHPPARAGHDLSAGYEQADNIQKYKYVIHNVAAAYGKTVTFMPNPAKGDNGSGMHEHVDLEDGKPPFAGDKYADLSQEALYFIGGILIRESPNALTNPATNSYKRLIPGFEALVLRAYSARKPLGLCAYSVDGIAQLPSASRPVSSIRLRVNLYLAFAALLMAGIDASRTRSTWPGPDKDLYDLPPGRAGRDPDRCGVLARREELEKGHGLCCRAMCSPATSGKAISLKWEEVYAREHTPIRSNTRCI